MMVEGEAMKGRRLHFIAIGGAGMSGLALVCRSRGAEVTGSDRGESSYMERLRAAGINPSIGHDAGQVPAGAEVVVSTAVPEDNPELVAASERGQRVIHRGELLAELCDQKRLLAVAGTHGKTTTAAMCIWALRAIGADPAFFLGGELRGAGPGGTATNADWARGEWVVAEADESDGSFLKLQPEVAVITNLELDHHSRWSSLTELSEAFAAFSSPVSGLLTGADVRLPGQEAQRVVRFALDEPAGSNPALRRRASQDVTPELLASEIRTAPGGGMRFRARGAGMDTEVVTGVPGRHNVANALAAIGGLALAGFDPGVCAAALADFPGVARRLELKGTANGARVYDDYAHHPTEVAATLEAARELKPRRLIADFQPHLYSRTKALASEFGTSLAAADEVAVLDVYPAREQPVGPLSGVTGLLVAQAVADHSRGRRVWWLPTAEAAAAALRPRLGEGDIMITIGAGDIYRLAEALVEEGGE